MPATAITARTPATALRKLWEIVTGQKASTFVVVSAFRAARTPEENQAKDQELQGIIRQLRLRAVPLNGLGQEWNDAGELGVATEKSYLIAGVSQGQAEGLCRRFDQDAVVFGRDGKTQLLLWDRTANVFSVGMEWDNVALYREKAFDPASGSYKKEDPGTATYRSDDAKRPGVGFTFFNEAGVADAIHEAAQRLIAKKEITVPLSRVDRGWIDWSKDIEQKVQDLQASGDPHKALQAMAKFKELVRNASKDPEAMVRFLVNNALKPSEVSRRTVSLV